MAIENIVSKDNLGNSFSLDNTAKKINLKVDNETITVGEDGTLSAAAGGGIDLDNIPEKRWKDGTTVLAKQDGELVRLNSSNIFTDVTISVTTSKSSIEEQQTFQVKYIITNSGVDVNEKTILTIVKPSSGSYTIANQSHVSSGAGSVTQDGDTYTITQLGAGGTVTVTFDVTATGYGTLSFGGQVQPVGVDVNGQNNTATTVVNVKKPVSAESSNPIPVGKQGALIKAWDVATGKQLKTFACSAEYWGKRLTFEEAMRKYGAIQNVYAEIGNFAGKQIRIEGASSIVASTRYYDTNGYKYNYIGGRIRTDSFTRDKGALTPIISPDGQFAIPLSTAYGKELGSETLLSPPGTLHNVGTFNQQTGIFTFSNDFTALVVTLWVRPSGEKGVWQGITLRHAFNPNFIQTPDSPIIHVVESGKVNEVILGQTKESTEERVGDLGETQLDHINVITGDLTQMDVSNFKLSRSSYNQWLDFKPSLKYRFELTPSTVATFETTNPNYKLNDITSVGNIEIEKIAGNKIRVTTSANATSSDNLYLSDFLSFVIVDS